MRLAPYRKAVLAGLVALLGALGAALDGGVTLVEAEGALLAGMVAWLGVYAVPNEPVSPARQ